MSSPTQGEGSAVKRKLGVCSYGDKCYRKNPKHFEEYSHPHLEQIIDSNVFDEIVIPKDREYHVSQQTLKEQLQIVKNAMSKNLPTTTTSRSPLKVPKLEPPSPNGKRCEFQNTPARTVKTEPPSPAKSTNRTSSLSGHSSSSSSRPSSSQMAALRDYQMSQPKSCVPIAEKLKAAAPYNFFLTSIAMCPETLNDMNTVSFKDLLDPSLGNISYSIQFNFMVQLGWLLAEYLSMNLRHKPLTLVYGEIDMEINDSLKSFITDIKVKPPSPFGCHHTKMMMFAYDDESIRIVISTANLVESDWENRTQGLWISPKCPKLPLDCDTSEGDSVTGFKYALLKYLHTYNKPELMPWIQRVKDADMTAINVFFLSSAPGSHNVNKIYYGLTGLTHILNNNIDVPEKNSYQVIAQASSIGSLGPRPDAWITTEFMSAFCSGKKLGVPHIPQIKIVYPSFDNVVGSYEGLLGGGCLPYPRTTHLKQEWLTSFMCLWKSDRRQRTRAPPHIKSYCRVSPDMSKLSYFVLTSANISKAAWGNISKSGSISILSYEAGVVFIPKIMINKDYFPLKPSTADDNTPIFPMPYDLPVTPYSFSDIPWFIDHIS